MERTGVINNEAAAMKRAKRRGGRRSRHARFRGFAKQPASRPSTATVADALLEWLRGYDGEHLPALGAIAASLPAPSHHAVWNALNRLHHYGHVRWRHGTRDEARGHQAICITASGRVLKTAGCPFEAPA